MRRYGKLVIGADEQLKKSFSFGMIVVVGVIQEWRDLHEDILFLL